MSADVSLDLLQQQVERLTRERDDARQAYQELERELARRDQFLSDLRDQVIATLGVA